MNTYQLQKPAVEIDGDELRIKLVSFTTGKHIQFNVPWKRANDIPLVYMELEHLYQIGELSCVQVEQTKREIMRAVHFDVTGEDDRPADRGIYWFLGGACVIVALWGWLFVDSLVKVWR